MTDEYSADEAVTEEETPAIKTVEVDGLGEVPARFASQEQLASYSEGLNDKQFVVFADLLRSRKWSKQELEERVQILRPSVDILSKPASDDDSE